MNQMQALTYSFLAVVWITSLGIAGLVGHQLREVKDKYNDLEQTLTDMDSRKAPAENIRADTPVSTLIDPLDIRQRAQFERDQEVRNLNP